MKLTILMTAAAISGFHASDAWSAEYEVKRTLQLSSPASEVWNLIGDFCDVDDWHPAFKACSLKVIDGGIHRVLTAEDGAETVQKLIATEPGISYTYVTTSSPLPIENYVATIAIESLDGSLISWSSRFSSDDPTMEAAIVENYESGLSAIESALEDQ